MFASTTRRTLLVAAALTALGACDDRPIDFGQPPNTPVSQLSPQQMKDFCLQALRTTYDALLDPYCTARGLAAGFSGQGMTCEQARQDCLRNPPDGWDAQRNCANADQVDTERLKQCDITVGEIEACYNDAYAAMKDAFAGISCSSTAQELSERRNSLDLERINPESCQRLRGRCPGIDFGMSLEEQAQSGGGKPPAGG